MEVVTPLAGVWIEILPAASVSNQHSVTPLAGVWIEIAPYIISPPAAIVTPLAGVWIEMRKCRLTAIFLTSLPLRECGLK